MCCLEVQKVGDKRVHKKWKIWMQNCRRAIAALVSKKGSPASGSSVEKDLHMRGAESRRHSAWLRGSQHTWARRRGGPVNTNICQKGLQNLESHKSGGAQEGGRSGAAGRQVVVLGGIQA
ncbi:hypothetical protein JB92DRAFT_2826600 [Gautieria morchelliformis]|nr:hypothetical protein JB92DRAFT_2826600 [Gautieria morchelliformis]